MLVVAVRALLKVGKFYCCRSAILKFLLCGKHGWGIDICGIVVVVLVMVWYWL